jgi:hypothetical protein
MTDPYREPLEFFTFAEMLAALESISDETLRLDFKESLIPKTDLAHLACSFANAEGGLIVVGVKDPARYGVAFQFGPPTATDDNMRLRLQGQVNSRVYPPIPSMEVHGYQSDNGARTLLVMRVPRSDIAPHECRCGTGPNLPVRRGTGTEALSLAEIDLLRLRRNDAPVESPLFPKRGSLVATGAAVGGGAFAGITIGPAVYLRRRRVMDHADDMFCDSSAAQTRGLQNQVHDEFRMISYTDSNYFIPAAWEREQGNVVVVGPRSDGPPQAMEICSDGDIALRLGIGEEDPFPRFVYALLMSYTLAQDVFYRFGISPEARIHVYASFAGRQQFGVGPIPSAYEDWFKVNLATDRFADAFVDTTMRLSRSADRSADRDVIVGVLAGYSRDVLPRGDALRERWLRA